MSVVQVSAVAPFSEVITTTRIGKVPLFRMKNEKKRLVLGLSRNGFVPLKVSDGKSSDVSYVLVREARLQELISLDNTSVGTAQALGDKDYNLQRLWDYDGFWDLSENEKPKLKLDSSAWVSFHPNGRISVISKSKPDTGSFVELRANENTKDDRSREKDPYDLRIGSRENMPINLYEQIEVFNWLLVQVKLAQFG